MRSVLSALIIATITLITPLQAKAEDYSSTYERVMETGTIRCAYVVVPPEFNKDPNTGEFSGIGYEVMERVGDILELDVKWTEEVGAASVAQGLKTGRYDAVCYPIWNRGKLAREAAFTRPFMYSAVGIYVRADDDRFSGDRSKINDKDVTIAAIDGGGNKEIAQQHFPKAQILSMPDTTNVAQMLRNVATGKADVTFTYPANFKDYQQNNPGQLKAIHKDRPVRVFGNTFMVPKGEDKLRNMLNTAIHQALVSGEINRIIDKYEDHEGEYYRIDMPYKLPTK